MERVVTAASLVSAALPYRVKSGNPEVLLVRSSAGRWIVPKGHIDLGELPSEAAQREAWEEAGIRGDVATQPCGFFIHESTDKVQHVIVYPLLVREIASWWPEQNWREQGWFSTATLPRMVPHLQDILNDFVSNICE